MSGPVIIRLQNLPLEARTLDIRRFFEGLSIPDGGVHIIGGEKGDAFIAFNSDEDARQAMARDSQLLCGARIRLLLSSKTEMHTVISAARTGTTVPVAVKPPQVVNTYVAQQQQQQLPTVTSNNDLLSSLTKLISTPNVQQQQQQQQQQQPNLLDQLKTLFPSTTANTATTNTTSPNGSYLSKPPATGSNLPPALADIFNKPVANTQQQQQQYYDPTKSQQQQYYANTQQTQAPNTAPTATAAATAANPLLNQVNINQLLSLLTNTLNQAAPAATTTVVPQQQPVVPQYTTQQPQQQQVYQQQQQQQPSYQSAAPTSSSSSSGTYNKYYQTAPSYKQDQSSTSNRSSNEYQSYNSSSSSTNNRYDSNNGRSDNNNSNYRNNGNKRYNDQYSENFNDRRYSRDDDDRGGRRGGGGGGGGRSQLDPIIRVRNFNQNCSYKDIRTFLQGIQIEHDGIKLITDSSGNRTGMAYVRLCGIIDLKKALCRNGQYFDTRTIEVVQSTQHEFGSIDNYYQKNKSGYSGGGGGGGSGSGSYQSSRTTRQDDYYQDDRNNNVDGDDRHYQSASAPAPIPVQQPESNRSPATRYTSNNNDENAPNGYYLKIFGLPTRFDRQSLQNEFNNVKFMRIQTIFKQDLGRPMLIVEVETKLDLERALTRHNEKVNRQKIQVFEMTKDEFEQELNLYYSNRRNKERNGGGGEFPRRRFNNDDSNDGQDGGDGEDDEQEVLPPEDQDPNEICVYLSGVPFSARNADVNYFFQDMNLLKINLLQDPETFKATGECCCMFKTKEDRDRAISEKDDQLLRGRVVKIKPITYAEYQEYCVNRKKSSRRYGNGTGGRTLLQTPINADDRPKLMDDNGNNSNGDDDNDQQDDEEDDDQQQQRDDEQDYNDQREDDDGGHGDPRAGRGRYNDYQSRRGNFRGGSNNNNNYSGYKRRANNSQSPHDYNTDIKRSKPSAELPPLPPELAGIENLVLLRNVSHKATREDILEMLRQYNAKEQTLKIRQFDNGKPTGEAIVAFDTRDDVVNFLQQMNGNPFMGRALRITEVN